MMMEFGGLRSELFGLMRMYRNEPEQGASAMLAAMEAEQPFDFARESM